MNKERGRALALMLLAIIASVTAYSINAARDQKANTEVVEVEVEIEKEDPIRSISYADSVSYPAKLVRVIDGDTYELQIHIWEDIVTQKKIRLFNVDTPELRPRKGTDEEKAEEKRRALLAKKFVEDILKDKQIVFAYAWDSDSFGRALGTVIWRDAKGAVKDICIELKNAGLATDFED